ncbi:MAG: hypothetical protein ACMG6H_16860, partial [Acidobacteriota bacterium]
MTNTLHRYGSAESFQDDYIIFAIPCKGKNDEGAIEKLKTFLRICAKYVPANMGNSNVSIYTPAGESGRAAEWARDANPDYQRVINAIDKVATASAVFDSREHAEACLAEVKQADLGLSINMSTSVQGAKQAAEHCGIHRHSVE